MPGSRSGTLSAPPSKSYAQRLLICAALGTGETIVDCGRPSRDVIAVADCLRALGAGVEADEKGVFHVTGITSVPPGLCKMPCGESGAALRFLLPAVGALGARAVFHREGRLPLRPLEPLVKLLREHGMKNVIAVQTGKASALRIEVPPLKVKEPFTNTPKSDIIKCFDAIASLSEVTDIFLCADRIKGIKAKSK